ncbi:MAG: sodium:solute symporter [Phycisphaerae bacterium]
MNWLDYVVLFGSILAIALYGVVRTRGKRDLHDYLRGKRKQSWLVIGLSVMATQASAITFLSMPGQGYASGLSFVQNYFAMPVALVIIAAVFLPLYRKLNVYTAYEFLGKRFDKKTRLLAAFLFLIQRGLGAGITIYAPSIVLSTIFGWSLSLTIVASSLVVIVYTVVGGSDAVTHTQKYQFAIIMAGMVAAFVILLMKLPCSFGDAIAIAGHFGKLNAVSFSTDPKERYTFWTGMIGGLFLMLSYFGTDQSQVQRYIAGDDLRESRFGLMFNALLKIPMQFGILLLGVLLFVFYVFHPAPIFFNKVAWNEVPPNAPRAISFTFEIGHGPASPPANFEQDFRVKARQQQQLAGEWLHYRNGHPSAAAAIGIQQLEVATALNMDRAIAKSLVAKYAPTSSADDKDYVFIHFILENLPHGLIGLLVAAFFAAALSSKAAELNALASTSVVDLYRTVIRPSASDRQCVIASKGFTVLWGLVAMGFALFARMSENLIQASNIVGSIFYGVVLGIFLVAFFLKWIRGSAIFWSAVVSQLLVFVLYSSLSISYLWYNLIGCGACVGLAVVLQAVTPRDVEPRGFEPVMETHV